MSSLEREDGEFSSEYVQFEESLGQMSSRRFGLWAKSPGRYTSGKLSPTFMQSWNHESTWSQTASVQRVTDMVG